VTAPQPVDPVARVRAAVEQLEKLLGEADAELRALDMTGGRGGFLLACIEARRSLEGIAAVARWDKLAGQQPTKRAQNILRELMGAPRVMDLVAEYLPDARRVLHDALLKEIAEAEAEHPHLRGVREAYERTLATNTSSTRNRK
jgi:hypothetical protein